MAALASKAENLDFRSLETAVFETVQEHGPIGIADIRRALERRRHLLDVTISMALGKDKRILKLPGRIFEIGDRVFCGNVSRLDVEDAIRICLLDGPRTAFAVVNMLKSNEKMRAIGVGPELVSSLAHHMLDVQRIGDRLSLAEISQELGAYKDITSELSETGRGAKAMEPVVNDVDTRFGRYAALDCRGDYRSENKTTQPESIQSILDSFGEL